RPVVHQIPDQAEQRDGQHTDQRPLARAPATQTPGTPSPLGGQPAQKRAPAGPAPLQPLPLRRRGGPQRLALGPPAGPLLAHGTLAPGCPATPPLPAATRVGRAVTQLRSNRNPASPDFSGWNWVAEMGPASTAATNSPPWTLVVMCDARAASSAVGRAA